MQAYGSSKRGSCRRYEAGYVLQVLSPWFDSREDNYPLIRAMMVMRRAKRR